MDLFAYGFNGATVSIVCKDNRIPKIWVFIGLLGIHTDEVQMFPDLLKQAVEVELHVAANNNSVGLLCDHVDLLHRNSVNFVVAIQALYVLPVS